MVLMETRQVKGALKAMPIKTDRRDAEGIARLLHLGWFRPVHCKSVSAQETRAVLGPRKAIPEHDRWNCADCCGTSASRSVRSRGRFETRIQELAEGNPMLEGIRNARRNSLEKQMRPLRTIQCATA